MPRNDLPEHRPNAVLEGDDPPPDEDEFLSGVIPLDHRVSDEEAQSFIRDILGGSGNAAFKAQIILKRFAEVGWRITKGA